MRVVQCSQNVSLAHRPGEKVLLGNNLTIKLAVAADGEFSFQPLLDRVKARLDHRCLFEDEPRFLQTPSTLEAITTFVAEDPFQQPLQGAEWVSVEVSELERFRCKAIFGEPELRMEIRHRNLTLQLSKVAVREEILIHVDQVFNEICPRNGESEALWGERLFIALRSRIPALLEASVDLGRHRSIRLAQVR